jgi:co-chaperonin GroES (HSP10)
MIIPAGHRILVKQDAYDEKDEVFRSARAAGIEVIKDKTVRYQESVDVGTIIKVGPTAWKDFGGSPWAEEGDKVVFAKHAGKRVEDPEDKDSHYVILNDEDIVAIVKGE